MESSLVVDGKSCCTNEIEYLEKMSRKQTWIYVVNRADSSLGLCGEEYRQQLSLGVYYRGMNHSSSAEDVKYGVTKGGNWCGA